MEVWGKKQGVLPSHWSLKICQSQFFICTCLVIWLRIINRLLYICWLAACHSHGLPYHRAHTTSWKQQFSYCPTRKQLFVPEAKTTDVVHGIGRIQAELPLWKKKKYPFCTLVCSHHAQQLLSGHRAWRYDFHIVITAHLHINSLNGWRKQKGKK